MERTPRKKNESAEGQTYELPENDRMAIEQLEEPLGDIVEALLPEIQKGAYSAIIGDDASGRIPTLMMSEVIKGIYARQGRKSPVVRFMAGSSWLSQEERSEKGKSVAAHMEKIANNARESYGDGKVLIVTDTIHSGGSIATFVEAIKKNNWSADVATVGISQPDKKDTFEKQWNAKVVYGMEGNPEIYTLKAWPWDKPHGVEKSPYDLFAQPTARLEQSDTSAQRKINAARHLVSEIAGRILARIEETSEQKTA